MKLLEKVTAEAKEWLKRKKSIEEMEKERTRLEGALEEARKEFDNFQVETIGQLENLRRKLESELAELMNEANRVWDRLVKQIIEYE